MTAFAEVATVTSFSVDIVWYQMLQKEKTIQKIFNTQIYEEKQGGMRDKEKGRNRRREREKQRERERKRVCAKNKYS